MHELHAGDRWSGERYRIQSVRGAAAAAVRNILVPVSTPVLPFFATKPGAETVTGLEGLRQNLGTKSRAESLESEALSLGATALG